MATYVPNATDATEPVASKTVASAAEEFRTLKASVNAMRQWLGVHATAPTVDTLGNAVSTGDFYYNSTVYKMYVYQGADWRAVDKVPSQVVSVAGTYNILPTGPDILVITAHTGNSSFTASSMIDGQSSLILIVNPGVNTVTWPAGIKWLNGVTPTLLATGTTFVELIKINGVLYGVALGGAV